MTTTTDTETEANRQMMTETFEDWRDGAEPFPDTWASDMVWRLEGHSVASKEYASKHEYVEEFVKPFGARFLASERFRPTNIRSIHADGDTVIVLWDGRGIAIDGEPYENTYAFFMRMRDRKVVEVTALTDSISLNELLERVQPAMHVDSTATANR
jgi:ketosteroid isomerase-like protein